LIDFNIVFVAPGALLSMNKQQSYSNRKLEQLWRDTAYYAYIQEFPNVGPAGRRLPPCHVRTALPIPDRRRRDPINFAATVKRIVDGITVAGAWPDDCPEFVTQHVPSFRVSKDQLVVVRITERTEQENSDA
jgi:Holliday junction resolvase RusA-like endonuclease